MVFRLNSRTVWSAGETRIALGCFTRSLRRSVREGACRNTMERCNNQKVMYMIGRSVVAFVASLSWVRSSRYSPTSMPTTSVTAAIPEATWRGMRELPGTCAIPKRKLCYPNQAVEVALARFGVPPGSTMLIIDCRNYHGMRACTCDLMFVTELEYVRRGAGFRQGGALAQPFFKTVFTPGSTRSR